MKQAMKFLAALCCGAVCAAMPLTASADDNLFPGGSQSMNGTTLDGKWEYLDYGDGRLSVTCKDKTIVNAEVPDQINGKPVTMIDQDCFLDNTSLESVTLPNTITHINDWAFSGCTSLKSISLPDGLTTIDWQAFYGCSSLEEITIPASVDTIDKFIFEGCTSMKAVHVSDGNDCYTDDNGVLFDQNLTTLIFYPPCKSDTAYTVPGSCTKIEDWAFIGNTYLEAVDLMNVAEIGEDAFYHCTALKSIDIPDTVTVLNPRTFGGCMALENVQLSSMLDEIGEHCFYNCLSLKEITIPGRVDTIGNGAFLNCPELKSIALNDAVKTIGEYALGFCVDAETQKYIRTPDFVVDTDGDTAAHEYCAANDIKSTGGVTQSSVFLTVMIVIVVLVVAVTIAIIIIQKQIQKRYELR